MLARARDLDNGEAPCSLGAVERDVTAATIRYRDTARRARSRQSVVLPRSASATDVVPGLVRPGDRVLTKTSMDGFVRVDRAPGRGRRVAFG
jgi:hypothetical protein